MTVSSALLVSTLLLVSPVDSFIRGGHHQQRSSSAERGNLHCQTTSKGTFAPEPSFYTWRQHRIRFTERRQQQQQQQQPGKAAIVFVHGFGASFSQFRDNLPAAYAEGYDVFGLDLLGFGGSAKPLPGGASGVVYSIDTWSDQLSDFLADVVVRDGDPSKSRQPVMLVGNSIGSLVCANLASRDPKGLTIDGLALLNCAGGMNAKLVLNEPGIPTLAKDLLLRPLLGAFDWLLTSPATQSLAQGFFDDFRSRENVQQVLGQVYVNAEARVDDALVSSILAPADDPNAFKVFCAVLSGDPGPHPTVVFPKLEAARLPVCFLWGDTDPWTPLSGDTAQFMRAFAGRTQQTAGSAFTVLPNVGHCPHDDAPAAVNRALLAWLGSWLEGVDSKHTAHHGR